MFYTYMIRCEDNSLYTGYTNDLEKRMKAHFGKAKVAAKYTKTHKPIKLESVWRSREKSLACKLEYQIKAFSKKGANALAQICVLSEKITIREPK